MKKLKIACSLRKFQNKNKIEKKKFFMKIKINLKEKSQKFILENRK